MSGLATLLDCAGKGSETSGLAMLLVRASGAETFVPWTLLERAGVQRQTVLAMLRIIYPYEEMRGWLFYYSSQWFACLASHTSRSNSPVAHPSFFPFQMRLTSKSECYWAGALGVLQFGIRAGFRPGSDPGWRFVGT
ncbi:hypothetical protein DY000_02022821 [Brassica cretica]|uniref:Uncharacterized protein n=1 Tax=Brassica cretica TaxID=69181 RepID=A0ABQ7EJM5_BRACR|nr:hypothetical protein DY000_02022821 [Brassica cretica]